MSKNTDFRPLSRTISVYEPRDVVKGQLIILATWLGASMKHIAKYTSLYKTITPSAKILLIEAPIYSVQLPYAIQERTIRPAIGPIAQALEECDYSAANNSDSRKLSLDPHILLHIFSNGGANNVLQLLRVWKSEMGMALPLSGLIIDSALATGGAKQNYRGFQQSIPDGMMYKIVGPVAASYGLLVLETSIALGRYPRPETAIRQCVLDETLIQLVHGENANGGSGKRICYFASKADANTPYQDIVSHAKEARTRGWEVDLHLWDDTPHCNHLSRHEEEYVRAVRSMWMGGTPEASWIRAKL